MFSDIDILNHIRSGDIIIEPLDMNRIEPNSYDISLKDGFVDVRGNIINNTRVIGPREFVLGTSVERVSVSDRVSAILHTRSSIGRMGIGIHATAGLVDAGFDGHITFEITNFNDFEIEIPRVPVGQLTFHKLETPSEIPYDGVYNGQVEPRISIYIS